MNVTHTKQLWHLDWWEQHWVGNNMILFSLIKCCESTEVQKAMPNWVNLKEEPFTGGMQGRQALGVQK